jgi:hypothetical protein
MSQKIENVQTFAGQTVTISFWAKASSTFTTQPIITQNFGTGGSSEVTTYPSTVSIGTSWNRYSVTVAVPSISGKTIGAGSFLGFNFTLGTSEGAFTLDLWGVQVEASTAATPFQTATGTIQGELAAAQRYYQRITPSGQFSSFGSGIATSTTAAVMNIALRTSMRITPTAVDYSNLGVSDATNTFPITSMSLSTSSSPDYVKLNSVVASGLVQYRPADFVGTTASHFIGFTSEL